MSGGSGQVVGTISIKVTPDTKHFRRELKAEVESIEKEINGKIKFKADFDASGLREKVNAAAKASQADVKVKANVDNSDFAKLIAEVKAAAKAADAKINIDFRDKEAEAKLAALIGKLKAQAKASSIKLKVDVDSDWARRGIMAGIGKTLSSTAGGIGSAMKMMADDTTLIAVAIVGFAAPAVALLSGLLVALPGIAAAALAPIAALALGFKGIGEALVNSGLAGRDKKGKLKIGPQLEGLMDSVGAEFEKGLTPAFKDISDKLFPALAQVVPPVAASLSNMAKSFTDVVTQGRGLESIKSIFSNIGETLNRAAPGVASFTTGLLTLADKLVAKLPGLGDSFTNMGNKFLGWVDKITTPDASGVSAFDTAMSNVKGTLKEILGLIGNITGWGWDNISSKDFGERIKEFAKDLGHLVTDTLPGMQKAFEVIATTLKPITAVIDGFSKLNGMTGGWLGKILGGGIMDAFEASPDGNKAAGQKAGQQIAGGVTLGLQDVLSGNGGLPPKTLDQMLLGPAGDPAAAGQQTGQQFAQGVQQGLQSTPPAVDPKSLPTPQALAGQFDAVIQEIQGKLGALGPAVQTALAQVNPALDGFKQGLVATFDQLGPMITGGITNSIPQIVSSFQGIGTAISGQFGALVPLAQQAFQNVTEAAKAGLANMVSEVQAKGQEVVAELQSWPGKFQGAVGDLSNTLVSAGVNLGQGLANGINQGKGAAIAAAVQMANEVRAATESALGIKSPSRVFKEIGQYSATGFQEGLEGGFQGVIERATSLAQAVSDAMKDGFVGPDLKNQLKKEMSELALEYKQLKVEKDALPKGKEGKAARDALSDQMAQVQSLKDQLGLQQEQLGYSKKNSDQMDSTNEAAQMITKALASVIDMGKSFAMSNVKQFENDLGISGNGAIPQVAEAGLGWLTGMLGKQIDGAFGVGKTEIHVNSVDDALAAQQNIRNRQALGIAGR